MAVAKQLSALALAALGLLVERAMHPYEMYQLLMHRHEDRLLKVRPGTLYHAVGRLAEAGLVEATGTVKDGNRPERTNYAILPAGRASLTAGLRELLAEPVKEYPRFPQALSEAHNLPAAEVIELLAQRVVALGQELAALDADRKLALSRDVPRHFWIDVDYQQHLLRAELAWIETLRAQLDDGSLPWMDGRTSPQILTEIVQL
ncbi:Transcriptional regulator, PadR family [Arthrobacter sp. PAMC 25486]|uniref:PadR family transcriptional regulator n=1 Tax=Arthrobacter sp. PAMC 25486 TaxID=1494608 RepID=UPI0005360077|nr:PadR family transcriptional regulator [Arthrobacter sp. PAMC 25486]AIY01755.1 Transcriptional regulator, PadR family [Arthrobacter sp. PAMC 25486]